MEYILLFGRGENKNYIFRDMNCGTGEDLRVPWTARKSNQSILKEINPEYSLEGLMAEAEAPTLWSFDTKSQVIGKDPDAGKDREEKEKGATG